MLAINSNVSVSHNFDEVKLTRIFLTLGEFCHVMDRLKQDFPVNRSVSCHMKCGLVWRPLRCVSLSLSGIYLKISIQESLAHACLHLRTVQGQEEFYVYRELL